MKIRTQLAICVLVTALLVGLNLEIRPGAIRTAGVGLSAEARVAGVGSIVARERASGSTSLTVSTVTLEDLPTARRFDQLLATLPIDRRVTAGNLPSGWQLEQKGKQVRTWGPGVDNPNLRLDLNGNYMRDYVGKEATIQLGLGGTLDAPTKVAIGYLPKVSTTAILDGILTVPPQATLNMPIFIGVSPGYRTGSWEVLGREGSVPILPLEAISKIQVNTSPSAAMYGLDPGALVQLKSKPAPRPFVVRFDDWGPSPRVKYTDPWGEVTVDAPITIQPTMPTLRQRTLFGGSLMTFAGQAACVSGNFPSLTDSYGLLLDGKTELLPWAASPTAVMLGIPVDTVAGQHTISDPSGSSSITIGVLTVEANLDQNKLWTGQSTTMRLRVIGTDEKFPIGLLNRSPGVITVEGGAQQTITTPGGADNAITRSVKGIQRGDFNILYSVNVPGRGPTAK